jgi:hypothetical protein
VPTRAGLPFRKLKSSDHFIRSVLALARAELTRPIGGGRAVDPHQLLQEDWPGDNATPILLDRIITKSEVVPVRRTATVPADSTTSGWAANLVAGSLAAFLTESLAPATAASELFTRSHVFNFGAGVGVLTIPGLVAAASDTPWVAAGSPIPVRQINTANVVSLRPYSFKTICVLTHEMVQGSNAEQILRMHLGASVGQKLDAALFASTTTTAIAPGGLLAPLSTLGATSGTTADALRLDVGKLVDAVAPVAGTNIVFVAAPGAAAKMLGALGPQFPYPILTSGALAAQTVVCIAPDALAVAVDPTPQIDISQSATVTLEDTSPLALVDGSSTVAPGTRSLWQTASIGIKLTMQLSFGLRHASGAAMISGCTW